MEDYSADTPKPARKKSKKGNPDSLATTPGELLPTDASLLPVSVRDAPTPRCLFMVSEIAWMLLRVWVSPPNV